jgi:hypothetical protein
MSELWLSFLVVVSVQCIWLLVSAWHQKTMREIPRALVYGACIGVAVGLPIELVFGKYLGMYSYGLGFSLPFLLINESISFGIFAANTFLVRGMPLRTFYIWSVVTACLYECVNIFFPVWAWHFAPTEVVLFLVIFFGYFSGAFAGAIIWEKVLGSAFVCLRFISVYSRHTMR